MSTSAAVFVGLIGSMMGYPLLDPLAGLLVAGLIVRQVRLQAVFVANWESYFYFFCSHRPFPVVTIVDKFFIK